MRNKAVLNALLAVVLIACVVVGATLAYLTDATEVNVHYAYGTVKITVEEPAWATQVGDFFDANDRAVLYPGRKFEKDPVVHIDANSEDCYVRLKVVVDEELAKVIQIKPNFGSGWRLLDTGIPNEYYYLYTKKVKARETTPPAFTEVLVPSKYEVNGVVDNKEHARLLEAAKDQSITVTAQAIQAATFRDATEAFQAFDAGTYI